MNTIDCSPKVFAMSTSCLLCGGTCGVAQTVWNRIAESTEEPRAHSRRLLRRVEPNVPQQLGARNESAYDHKN